MDELPALARRRGGRTRRRRGRGVPDCVSVGCRASPMSLGFTARDDDGGRGGGAIDARRARHARVGGADRRRRRHGGCALLRRRHGPSHSSRPRSSACSICSIAAVVRTAEAFRRRRRLGCGVEPRAGYRGRGLGLECDLRNDCASPPSLSRRLLALQRLLGSDEESFQ